MGEVDPFRWLRKVRAQARANAEERCRQRAMYERLEAQADERVARILSEDAARHQEEWGGLVIPLRRRRQK